MRLRPVLLVGILAASGVRAWGARLEVGIEALADSRTLLERGAELEVGDEVRFVCSAAAPSGGRVEITALLSLRAASPDQVTVALSGVVRPVSDGESLAWTSRTFRLIPGESAGFVAGPDGRFRLVVGYRSQQAPSARARVELATSLRLERIRDGIRRRIGEHRIRLVGPEPTEVVLTAAEPGAGEASPSTAPGPALVLRLAPIARDDDQAILTLEIEVPATAGVSPRTIREERLELGWNDVVRIAGLSGPDGDLVVEIKPER